jgi:predicted dehydrogenase
LPYLYEGESFMKADLQPSNNSERKSSRRVFLQRSGSVIAGSLLTAAAVPKVHAGEENTIRLALIGCGGRGSGAVGDACSVAQGPVQLVAMADVIESRLNSSHAALSQMFPKNVDVPPDRRFVGFDAYRQAIDCLGPGDVAMLTGYAGFRPVQLEYAVAKGVNVFMEKSFAADPPGARRVIQAGDEAGKKNLKIAAGLMCRHSVNRHELIRQIRDGVLGEIQLIRAYRMEPVGPLGTKPPAEDELLWQFRNFFRFYWVSGGLFAEMDIHQIDEICWLKDALPVQAHGIGGRAIDSTDCSQNLDSFAIEWTFADGTKATDVVRYLNNCHNEFATYVHGTKCAAQFSGSIHVGTVQRYRDQRIAKDNIEWKAPEEKRTPWQAEWAALFDAIRQDRPHNEARRAAESNLVDMMGRAAVHSGQIITWDAVMASNFQFCPNIDQMDYKTPPPVQADAQGRYPAPVPGVWSET